jgi:hypothetical protein
MNRRGITLKDLKVSVMRMRESILEWMSVEVWRRRLGKNVEHAALVKLLFSFRKHCAFARPATPQRNRVGRVHKPVPALHPASGIGLLVVAFIFTSLGMHRL